ncbi:hypothetical protein H6P81_017417 [Aristolochia fimbriata]|uniref:ASCH domain-containing protein n=1 Tax=Aristolochia fimbriata TaxID=158543 RepID=A0AAV7DYH1_ARIFI|nr:hypothetical protein H6P81_017417 [Aristolochia fimbriata]
MNGRARDNYRNPCLTMHQPWASLLVYGIKRVEGRSWPAPIRGRLWIHAASKVPDPSTIKAMEDFYREIYAVNGITDVKFPEHYPVSRLLGCVEVVGCVKREELVGWTDLPEGVRLEGQTEFCWLCENPQKMLVPFEMRGFQGVYNLERKIYESAVRGLCPVQGPLPVKFQLPNPFDKFSLKPGSLKLQLAGSAPTEVEKPASLHAAIAGARAAATQFSKKEEMKTTLKYHNMLQERDPSEFVGTSQPEDNDIVNKIKNQAGLSDKRSNVGPLDTEELGSNQGHEADGDKYEPVLDKYMKQPTTATHKIFSAAMKGLRQP